MEQCSDTKLFMEKMRIFLDGGETMPLPVQGNSMAPFLVSGRDMVWLRKPDTKLKTGDIVLYQRPSGHYVLHRICSVKNGIYTMVGDAHSIVEPGIRKNQIFGRVVRIQRKGKIIEAGNFWWEMFAKVWIRMVPLRRPVLRCATCLMKQIGR